MTSDREELANIVIVRTPGGAPFIRLGPTRADAILASDWLARVKREAKAEAVEAEGRRWSEMNGMSWCSMQGRSLLARAAELRTEQTPESPA